MNSPPLIDHAYLPSRYTCPRPCFDHIGIAPTPLSGFPAPGVVVGLTLQYAYINRIPHSCSICAQTGKADPSPSAWKDLHNDKNRSRPGGTVTGRGGAAAQARQEGGPGRIPGRGPRVLRLLHLRHSSVADLLKDLFSRR